MQGSQEEVCVFLDDEILTILVTGTLNGQSAIPDRTSRPHERLSARWIDHQSSGRHISDIERRMRVVRTAHDPRGARGLTIRITSWRPLTVIAVTFAILDDGTNQGARGGACSAADRRAPHRATGKPTDNCATGRTVARSLTHRGIA